MSEPTSNPKESPHERFRRMLAEAQKNTPPKPSVMTETREQPPAVKPPAILPDADEKKPIQVIPIPSPKPVSPSDQTRQIIPQSAPQKSGQAQVTQQSAPVSLKPVPPPLGNTPSSSPPALGTHDMPLPRRVSQVDPGATRITPSAYQGNAPLRGGTTQVRPTSPKPPQTNTKISTRGKIKQNKRSSSEWVESLGCVVRAVVVMFFFLIFIGIIAGSIALYQYYAIARTLPNIDELRQRAAQFETTRIFDRNGNLLYEILDPNAGRRTYVSLDKISPYMIAAIIATEDRDFYINAGYDPIAIVRAFWQNYTSGDVVSGASTITQQLARSLLFTPEERSQRSYRRKLREAILASEITRRYSKDEILELYLNEIYYGNLAYGVEAASQTYFSTSAGNLNLMQASFLAGLPQAPSVYDVYTNHDAAIKRTEQVLYLMFQTSKEKGCIFVSNSQQPVCVDPVQAANAGGEIKKYKFQKNDIKINHPHWVNYIRSTLESQYDSQTIYRSGFSVYTTLDPDLQDLAEKTVDQQVKSLQNLNVHSGALVAIRPNTGEILAMVGSADYYGDTSTGQVNMAVNPRQPGSSIKPLTYVAAFEKGWTPATLIWDVPADFPPSGDPNDQRPPYHPVNYDGRFHGPATVRYALANSFNIPAVRTLQYVGVYGDPNKPGESGLIGMARRLGITTLTRNDYGLSLTLGGGDVSLLELTGAYAVFANGGRRIPAVAITRIVDHSGNEIFHYQVPAGDQAISQAHAFLISSILSDSEARTPTFGANSPLDLPFPAAAKTGTTNDFRDNWTMGYTPDLAVGVWVGNPDYKPMINSTGLTGAAPIWNAFMQAAVPKLTGGNVSNFVRPGDVDEKIVCALSGTEPSLWCPQQRNEFFAVNQPPLSSDYDLWRETLVDTWTNLTASRECSDYTEKIMTLNVTDLWAIKWITEDAEGKEWAKQMSSKKTALFTPARECKASDSRPNLAFDFPRDGQTVSVNPLDIYARVGATSDFDQYLLMYGLGRDPKDWQPLAKGNNQYQNPERIYSWDVGKIPSGEITFRLYINSTRSTFAEKYVRINLQVPTVTGTTTPTMTFTPTPTLTITPSVTPTYTPVIPTLIPPSITPTFPLPPSPLPTATFPPLPPTLVPPPVVSDTPFPTLPFGSETPLPPPPPPPADTPLGTQGNSN